jgi:hypothetical protein
MIVDSLKNLIGKGSNIKIIELSTASFKQDSPCAVGFLLPSVSTDGFKYRRQSLFLCGIYPLS